jgi:poly(3-hydroxybutyrate) depolymerase
MLYYLYEMNHAAMAPWRAAADAGMNFWKSPANPFSSTQLGRSFAASFEMFERGTRRYGKPPFAIDDVIMGDEIVPIVEETVLSKPFCNLLHFEKDKPLPAQPKLLIVAPMSGHYATLLRGTVQDMLPHFDVYITDWIDAR